MQSPYEERAGELLKEKKKELRSLKKEDKRSYRGHRISKERHIQI